MYKREDWIFLILARQWESYKTFLTSWKLLKGGTTKDLISKPHPPTLGGLAQSNVGWNNTSDTIAKLKGAIVETWDGDCWNMRC